MTVTEAARELNRTIQWVYQLLRVGKLTGTKLTGEWDITAESVAQYKSEREGVTP